MVEHLTFNQRVVGSSPPGVTIVSAVQHWRLILVLCALTGPAKAQFAGGHTATGDSTRDSIVDSTHFMGHQSESKKYLEDNVAFGGTIGTPGGINFIGEGYYHRFGIRLEAGAFPWILASIVGEQADLCFVLARGKSELVECSAFYYRFFTSSIDEPNGNWNSNYGIAIAFNGKGFFVQAGFSPDFLKTSMRIILFRRSFKSDMLIEVTNSTNSRFKAK